MARPTNDPKTYRLDLRFPSDMIAIIDEWRRNEPDIPPRAEAIRRLIMRGILDSREVQYEYFRLLQRLHQEGRLSDEEWSSVQGAVLRFAQELARRAPAFKESFERTLGLSPSDDQTG